MFSVLKSAWAGLTGGREGKRGHGGEEPAAEAEHKGFRIIATPYAASGGWQTAGTIEKVSASGARQHRFVRADTHPSQEAAVSFTIAKARQIIDERGEKLFGPD